MAVSYDAQRGLSMLAHYEEHERRACDAEMRAVQLRERLIVDGHLEASA